HLPRRGSALARPLARREGARLAAGRRRRGARAGRARGDREEEPEPFVDERRVLVGRRPRRGRGAPTARPCDVRLLANGRLVGAHPRAEAARRPRPPVRPLRRPGGALTAGGLGLAAVRRLAFVAVSVLALSACGGGSSNSTTTTASDAAQIKTAYVTFFDGKT